MATSDLSQHFKGFSKLTKNERLATLLKLGIITQDELDHLLTPEKLPTDLAEKFVENVLGYFQIPLGIATNFRIDGKDYVIPMAVEETSIIAAASKNARWIRDQGVLTTEMIGNENIGQIQFAKVQNFVKFEKQISDNKDAFIELANKNAAENLVKRGGGVRDLQIRQIKRNDASDMAVIHLLVDTCDAMGANMIIQICEYLKAPLQELTGESATMCILSNLNDKKITRARAVIHNIDPELGEKIAEATTFAHLDPYRAATHNKGIMNGIDPVIVATGNDWRAVEAAVHAYAARDGQYRSLTNWEMIDGDLVGTFEAPITVGIVGGMTKLHPTAQMSLNMLNIKSANDLARIIAAVGLVQNLGAIKALVTFGFIEGHLRLHISNLTMSAGAKPNEIPLLKKQLEQILKKTNRLTLTHAINALQEIREQTTELADA
jgi:hydroxymethylglutaryl-CoA reductase